MALLLTAATGAWAQDPDPIDLTPSADGTVWTLATMPDYDVELEVTYYTDAELDQMAADEVIAKITAIGTVTYTPESKALINAARTAYDALTAAQQALVTNISTLTDAETTYATAEETAYTEGVELTDNGDGTWTLAATPAFDVELEVEYETALALNEVDDNTAKLTEWNGYEADVTLTRTLVADMWNTIALPFNISSTNVTVLKAMLAKQNTSIGFKKLESSSLVNGELTLTFVDANEIKAGHPYLVKGTQDVNFATLSATIDALIAAYSLPYTNPLKGVIISKDIVPTETAAVDFIPTLGKTTITGDDANSVFFLASGNTLKHPTALPSDMKGFRAYFQLKSSETVRSFVLNLGDEETGITNVNGNDNVNEKWFDLNGRYLQVQPTQKGVYIVNGKKVIIK